MNLKLLTAAAVLTTTVAAPALAQDPAPRSPSVRQHQAVRAYHRDCGFWPGDVAADVIGGAIGTAGAIATAPFRNDAYAYNSGYYGQRYYGGYYNITTVLPVSPARHSEARTASATSVSNEAV